MLSTEQIASRLADLVGKGQFEAAQRELFAEDAVSIEPQASEHFAKETKGLRAIIEKGHLPARLPRLWWPGMRSR